MAGENQIKFLRLCCSNKTILKIIDRIGRNDDCIHTTIFHPAPHLPAETVKLTVGRQHLDGTVDGQAGKNPADELMSIWSKGDLLRMRGSNSFTNVLLRYWHNVLVEVRPLPIGPLHRDIPVLQRRLSGDVRPGIMTVSRKVQ